MNQNHERAEDHLVVDSLVVSEAEILTVDSVEVALITINVTAASEEENQAMVSAVVGTTMPVASVEVNLVDSDKKIAVLEAVTPVVALEAETPAASEVVTLVVVVASAVVTPADSEVETPVAALVVETPAVASAEEVVAVVTMPLACSLAAYLTTVPKTLFAPTFKVFSQMPQIFRYRQTERTQVKSREWHLLTLDRLQRLMLP